MEKKEVIEEFVTSTLKLMMVSAKIKDKDRSEESFKLICELIKKIGHQVFDEEDRPFVKKFVDGLPGIFSILKLSESTGINVSVMKMDEYDSPTSLESDGQLIMNKLREKFK